MKHIVHFSGGTGSWAAAKRIALRHGTKDMVLLCADTRMEDEDLYRFIVQGAANIGAPLVCLADGRTPWDVFFDVKFLGNSLVDPCSRILKRQLLGKWVTQNCNPSDSIHYVGIDWSEEHRFTNLRDRQAANGWRWEAPLCDAPYLSKEHINLWLEIEGITIPRLYTLGFDHNNCGGFCIKAGQAHYANLLAKLPERYAYHEGKEQEIRAYLGKDVSILRDRRGGQSKPLTLKQFRERIEAKQEYDKFDIGGCGCFSPLPDTLALEAVST